MPDVQRFFVLIVIAFLVFVAVLLFTLRKRTDKPPMGKILAVGFIVVVGGMFFARYSHLAFPHLSWLVYYGVPALATVFVPPLWLHMSSRETARYLPSAWLTAPAIHLFVSLFFGWHDYMPFPVYVPSLAEMIRLLMR